jgi:hypothetical protein
VEHTFACLVQSRWLVRDDERLPDTSAAMVQPNSIHRTGHRAWSIRRRMFRYKRKVAA